jgi:hypothetical protein
MAAACGDTGSNGDAHATLTLVIAPALTAVRVATRH